MPFPVSTDWGFAPATGGCVLPRFAAPPASGGGPRFLDPVPDAEASFPFPVVDLAAGGDGVFPRSLTENIDGGESEGGE